MSVTIHDEAVVCKGAVLKGTVAIGAGITAVTSRGVLFLVRRKHRIAIRVYLFVSRPSRLLPPGLGRSPAAMPLACLDPAAVITAGTIIHTACEINGEVTYAWIAFH